MENLIFYAVQAVTKRLKQNPMQAESNPNIIFCYFQPGKWKRDTSRYLGDNYIIVTAQKMKFFITDFFSKCDQIRSFLLIWSHLLKKSLMENFIFCTVCK